MEGYIKDCASYTHLGVGSPEAIHGISILCATRKAKLFGGGVCINGGIITEKNNIKRLKYFLETMNPGKCFFLNHKHKQIYIPIQTSNLRPLHG